MRIRENLILLSKAKRMRHFDGGYEEARVESTLRRLCGACVGHVCSIGYNIVALSGTEDLHIGHGAHLGGFVFGAFVGLYFKCY
jgi:hypothetical protein